MEISWIKGHAEDSDPRGGTPHDRWGNREADTLATQGGDTHHSVEALLVAVRAATTLAAVTQCMYAAIQEWHSQDASRRKGPGAGPALVTQDDRLPRSEEDPRILEEDDPTCPCPDSSSGEEDEQVPQGLRRLRAVATPTGPLRRRIRGKTTKVGGLR